MGWPESLGFISIVSLTTMAILFETLREPHLPAVVGIYNWYVANSTATFHTEPVAPAEMLEFLYIGHPRYKSFVIKLEEEIVGYCFLTQHKKRQAYDRTAEVTVYLHPEFRGQGIGRKALDHLEAEARAVNLSNLIGVISGDNLGSIRVFEKAGYVKCAHFRNVGEKFNTVLDVVAYQKELL